MHYNADRNATAQRNQPIKRNPLCGFLTHWPTQVWRGVQSSPDASRFGGIHDAYSLKCRFRFVSFRNVARLAVTMG